MLNSHADFEKLEIPLVVKLLNAYELAHVTIRQFPKFERYALGEKIETALLAALELVVVANSASQYEKERYLLQVNAKNEVLKLLYRLAFNAGFLDQRQYLVAQSGLQEIGRMTWGWIKYVRAHP